MIDEWKSYKCDEYGAFTTTTVLMCHALADLGKASAGAAPRTILETSDSGKQEQARKVHWKAMDGDMEARCARLMATDRMTVSRVPWSQSRREGLSKCASSLIPLENTE